MFKQILFSLMLITGLMTFVSCSNDEPETPNETVETETEVIEKDIQYDNPVIVYADGSTSTGVTFRRLSEYEFMLNYIRYKIVDSHIEVVGHDCTEVEHSLHGDVEIYSDITVDGEKYKVRKVIEYAFRCSKIKKIVLPHTIVELAESAFEDCSGLEEIKLSSSITRIPERCFDSCYNLKKIEIPGSVSELGLFCFYRCRNLEIVQFQGNIPSFPRRAVNNGVFGEKHSCNVMSIKEAIWIFKNIRSIYTTIQEPNTFNEYLQPLERSGLLTNLFYDDYASLRTISTIYVPRPALDAYKNNRDMLLYWDGQLVVEGYDPETFDINSLLE